MKLDNLVALGNDVLAKLRIADGIAPLLFRLILGPVMIVAGFSKLRFSDPDAGFFEGFLPDPNVAAWFGNPDWGLGLPFPDLLAFLAGWAEFGGGWLLIFGLLTRLVAIPLMITMIVAATTVHWDKGWFAVAPTNADTSAARMLSWVGIPGAAESLENSDEAGKRLSAIRSIVEENGNPDWLYEKGSVVILNNGIEFSATYFVMLLSLFFTGGGRFTSVDHYLFGRSSKAME